MLLLLNINFKECFHSTCFLAAGHESGSDLLLQNGSMAMLNFSQSSPTGQFDIDILCDGIVEGLGQSCTLMFGTVTFPDSVRNVLEPDHGNATMTIDIQDCEGESEFHTVNLSLYLSRLNCLHLNLSVYVVNHLLPSSECEQAKKGQ